MVKGATFYDGSDVEIKIGDQVYWVGEEDNVAGRLLRLDENGFSIKWQGEEVQHYELDAIAMIRPM